VIEQPNSGTRALTGNLVLNELSNKHFPEVASYRGVQSIDLQQLENVDSAGLAYIAQIKSHYSNIRFTGVSNKTHVLARLYGLSFIFKS
jgi:phospholipid transport system transporter-binding protein